MTSVSRCSKIGRPSNPQWGGWACASTNPGDLAPAQPYIKSVQILQCPSQASATNSAGPGSTNSCQDGGYTDYFYNSHVDSTPTTVLTSIAGTPGRNLSEFSAVTLTILLGDGQNTNATSFSHGGIDDAASKVVQPNPNTITGSQLLSMLRVPKPFQDDSGRRRRRANGKHQTFYHRIKAGTYREVVTIPKNKPFLMLRGESAENTVVIFNKGARDIAPDGQEYGTFRTATFVADGNDFTAENLTIENPAGPKPGQAIALSVSGDRDIFRKCRILGWQDTIFANRDRQYFEDCYIDGSVDFIFGGSSAWFERCHLHSKTNGYVTAASTPFEQMFGYVFSNCTLTAETGVRVELG